MRVLSLGHVVLKVQCLERAETFGDSHEEFCSTKADLDAAGVPIAYEADRAFTKSLHLLDPDGHEVELYIDTSDAWNGDLEALASGGPR